MNLLPEEIDDLDNEVRNLNFTLQHLSDRQSLILRQLNAAKSSTRALPTETLSTIFKYACPPPDNPIIDTPPHLWNKRSREALKLSHVCSRWRKVASSTPQLWQSMAILLYSHVDIQRSADLLSLHAQNVSVLPLSFCLTVVFGVTQLEPISNVLFDEECSRKVEVLMLQEFYPRDWLYHISPTFQRLKHLICQDACPRNAKSLPEYYQPHSEPIPEISAPSLERIVLHRIPATFGDSWETITVVDLQELDVSICAQILFHCPNLISFKCFDVSYKSNSPADQRITSLLLRPYLTDFTWPSGMTSWDDIIVKYIRFPTLKNLIWTGEVMEEEMSEFYPAFSTFLLSAKETLEVLGLYGETPWSEQNFQQLLSPLSQLRELRLEYCESRAPCNLIRALTGSNIDGSNKLLPSLALLSIQSCGNGFDGAYANLEWLAPQIGQMLQNRLTNFETEFTLIIDDSALWPVNVREQIRGMIRNGVKLKIVDNGRPVMWLARE